VKKYKKLLVIDPGITSGWATFNLAEGVPETLKGLDRSMGQVMGQRELWELLTSIQDPPDLVIYERFRALGDYKIHFGKENITEQNIGIVLGYAYSVGADIVVQDPENKRKGYAWAKLKIASNHKDSHRRDAYAHGEFYMVMNGYKIIRREVK
jgi:hypothetical protein